MPKVIIKKSLSKEEEINLLQQLKCDSYFHQYFSSADIDQMCENIRNDFAIESGCDFMAKTSRYECWFDELCKAVINGSLEDCYNHVVQFWGMKKLIIFKLENKMPLTEEENNYLVEQLKNL